MNQKKRRGSQSRTPVLYRIIAVLLVLLFLLPLFAQVFELAFAVDQEAIDALKRQQAETTAMLEDYSSRLSALGGQEDSAVARYDTLTSELDYLDSQIAVSENLIAQYQEEIALQNDRYQQAKENVAALTEDYVQAIRAMEMQGSTAFWSALFSAENLLDLFQTLNDLQTVTEAQHSVIEQMEQAKTEAEEASQQLAELTAEQQEAQAALEAQRSADEQSLTELDKVIAEILANKNSYAKEIQRLESVQENLDEEILEAETALAIQREEERKAAEEAARQEAARLAAEEAARQEAARLAAEEAARQTETVDTEEERAVQPETASRPSEEAVETEAPQEEVPEKEENAGQDGTEKLPQEDKPASSAVTGADVVAYAMQFVGNPYVWGGTSLTNGCDCSGFTMQVYAHFGYSLPHYSGSQRSCGVGVSYTNAEPGDLICYNGHVGIYIGSGQMVNAYDSAHGIIVCAVNTARIVAVRRILQ